MSRPYVLVSGITMKSLQLIDERKEGRMDRWTDREMDGRKEGKKEGRKEMRKERRKEGVNICTFVPICHINSFIILHIFTFQRWIAPSTEQISIQWMMQLVLLNDAYPLDDD